MREDKRGVTRGGGGMKKKSVVGWVAGDWKMRFHKDTDELLCGSPGYFWFGITKTRFKCPYPHEPKYIPPVKIRITIEEI